jgi:predicted TIM-barrel fold metal-dependent hydrolase
LRRPGSWSCSAASGLERVAELRLENVYVDTAHYLMYVYPGVMERMVSLLGADHVVFGTDVPLQGPRQMRFAIEIIEALQIPDADKDKILSGNARRIIEASSSGLFGQVSRQQGPS